MELVPKRHKFKGSFSLMVAGLRAHYQKIAIRRSRCLALTIAHPHSMGDLACKSMNLESSKVGVRFGRLGFMSVGCFG